MSSRGKPTAIFPGMDALAQQTEQLASDLGTSLTANLLAVRSKDKAAFEAVYAATARRVLSLVSRIVGDADTADDVASDVYLQVWRKAGDFDPERGNAMAWIMTISRSRALDALRRKSTSAAARAELEQKTVARESDDTPQDLLLATDSESAVHRALAKLKPMERQLLALAYFRGYSHSELADVTGQPLGTVKTQLRRTQIKLKERLLEESADAGDFT